MASPSLTCWPHNLRHSPLPHNAPHNTFQDIVLTSPSSAVFSILYSTVTLTPNYDAFISVPQCIVWWKCVKYSARYRVNNVSWRTGRRAHGRTGQKQYAPGHTMLSGGINENPGQQMNQSLIRIIENYINSVAVTKHQDITSIIRGGFRHDQHVRPNRAPHKNGAPTWGPKKISATCQHTEIARKSLK